MTEKMNKMSDEFIHGMICVVFIVQLEGCLTMTITCDIQVAPNRKFTDCSERRLKTIPDNIDNDTNVLDLSKNLISEIPSYSFEKLELLEQLNMSSNNISILKNNALYGLIKLRVLNLISNSLLISTKTLSLDLFMPVENLQELYLENNNVDQSSTYLEDTIGRMLYLKVLHIPGLHDRQFGSAYSSLTALTNLSLSSENCNIDIVRNNMFDHTLSLKMLDLSKCNIHSVDSCSFCKLSQLEFLDMSHNPPHGLKLIRNISYSLQFTNITTLRFTDMEDPIATGKRITKYDLEFASNTSVKRLFVSGNAIESFEEGSIEYLPPGLEEIDISDNRPVLGPYITEITKLYNLKSLTADDLNQYHYFKVPGKRDTRKSLQILTGLVFLMPTKLENLYVRNSRISYNIEEINLCPHNELRHVDFRHNALSYWKGPIRGLNKLEYVDLSNNFCEKIHADFFINMTSITSLNLAKNFIGYVIEGNTSCAWLKPLTKLINLNLYSNKIRILPPKCFSTLVSLETLNLKENFLSDWEVAIEHMPNISFINLCGNGIDGFPKDTRDHLSDVSKRRNVTIDLRDNKLECTCENIDFLEWFDTTTVKFVGKANYTCRDKHRKKLSMRDTKLILASLKKDCADYIFLNTILSVLIGCFILVITCGICYRYRWKISYFYYMTWGRFNLVQDVDKEKYCYDAYISYAEEDSAFTEGKLAPKLEILHGLSLYLFERDAEPGRLINATIVDNIEKSRKIILILTNSYVKNQRCLFELNMATSKQMSKKTMSEIMHLVQLESVPYNDMPPEVMTLFNSDSYIEYPYDRQGKNVFWERLKNTIKPSTEETVL